MLPQKKMLNNFSGYYPLKGEQAFLCGRELSEGKLCPALGDAVCRFDKRPGAPEELRTFFQEVPEELLSLTGEEKTEGIRFSWGDRFYQLGGAVKEYRFWLFTDLPIGEDGMARILSLCGERTLLGEEKGQIAAFFPRLAKGSITSAAFQKLLNGCYILLMNLSRQEILEKGTLYEVSVEGAHSEKSALALGQALLRLGKFTCPRELLDCIFKAAPETLTKNLKIVLASSEDAVVLCKEDAFSSWEAEKVSRLFEAVHIRLAVSPGMGGESLCCWKQLI